MISRKINIDEQKLHIENINNNGFTIIRGYVLNKTVKELKLIADKLFSNSTHIKNIESICSSSFKILVNLIPISKHNALQWVCRSTLHFFLACLISQNTFKYGFFKTSFEHP